MLIPILVLGGPLFWVVFLFWLVVLTWLLDSTNSWDYYNRGRASGVWAFVVTVGVVALLVLFGNGSEMFKWLGLHPWKFLAVVGLAYVPGAVIVTVLKWYFFCKDDAEDFAEALYTWAKDNNKSLTGNRLTYDKDKAAFLAYLFGSSRPFASRRWVVAVGGVYDSPYTVQIPLWRDNKARLSTWAAWWWIVGPWSLIDDVVRNFFNRLVRMLGSRLDQMSRWLHADMLSMVDTPPDETPKP